MRDPDFKKNQIVEEKEKDHAIASGFDFGNFHRYSAQLGTGKVISIRSGTTINNFKMQMSPSNFRRKLQFANTVAELTPLLADLVFIQEGREKLAEEWRLRREELSNRNLVENTYRDLNRL